jgi:hypothetical protein
MADGHEQRCGCNTCHGVDVRCKLWLFDRELNTVQLSCDFTHSEIVCVKANWVMVRFFVIQSIHLNSNLRFDTCYIFMANSFFRWIARYYLTGFVNLKIKSA